MEFKLSVGMETEDKCALIRNIAHSSFFFVFFSVMAETLNYTTSEIVDSGSEDLNVDSDESLDSHSYEEEGKLVGRPTIRYGSS